MKYTTHQAAQEFMTANGLEQGRFEEEAILTLCKEVAAAIPPSTKFAYAPDDMQDDEVILAANYYEVFKGNVAINTESNSAVSTQSTTVVVPAGTTKAELQPNLSDEQNAQVQLLLSSNLEKKAARTLATEIKNLLVRAPKASELYKGIQIKVTDEKNKLPEYANLLVDEAGNKEAYNKVVELVKSGKTTGVHMNDKSRKYMGVTITTIDDQAEGANKTITRDLDNNGLAGFLAFDVLCRIPSKNDLGVLLKGVKPKTAKGRKGEAMKAQGVPNIAWDGKTAVIASGDATRVVSVSEVKKGETKTGSLPIDISFKVYKVTKDDKGVPTRVKNQKGVDIISVIRLRGKSDKLPVLQRKAVYVDLFGEEANGTTIFATMSKTEQLAAIKVAADFVDLMGEAEGAAFGDGFKQIMQAVNATQTATTVADYV